MRLRIYKPGELYYEPQPPAPVETPIAGLVPSLDSDSDEKFEIQGIFYEDTNVLELEYIRSSVRGCLPHDDPLFEDREFEEYILDIYKHPDPWSTKYQVLKAEDYYYDPY